jgi:creatinine amidohydrolase
MAILALDRTTFTEVEVALAASTRRVAVLPLGALEAHGPHLGLATDVAIAQAMAQAAAAHLDHNGWSVLLAPAQVYAPVSWARALAGSVGPSAATFEALVGELLRGMAAWGVDVVAVANAHFDPEAVGALRRAVAAVRAAGMAVAFPDGTRRAVAATLGEEFASGACHAGRYETSIALAVDPTSVREVVAAGLPSRDLSLTAAMAAGAMSFAEAGAPDAWVGRPGEASAAEGRERVATLGRLLAETVEEAFAGIATSGSTTA